MKRCSKCGEEKSLDCFSIYSCRGKSGRRGACIECRKAQQRDYYYRDIEATRERKQKDYRKHATSRIEKSTQYMRDNPDKAKEYRDRWNKKNPQMLREKSRRYAARHPDKVREMRKSWCSRNPRKVSAMKANDFSRQVQSLSCRYVAHVITSNGSGLLRSDIPQALIEAKRVQLQIHRLLKEIKQ